MRQKPGSRIILLLLLLAWMAARAAGKTQVLMAAVLIAPLFQSAGYYNPVMGVIEPSPTYTFFYAWPSVLMLGWLALLQKARGGPRPVPVWETIALFALTWVLLFNGPLVPGVVMVVMGLECLGVICNVKVAPNILLVGWMAFRQVFLRSG